MRAIKRQVLAKTIWAKGLMFENMITVLKNLLATPMTIKAIAMKINRFANNFIRYLPFAIVI